MSRDAARLQYLASIDKKNPRLWRTQRVRGRQFRLVGSVWIDSRYTKAFEKQLRKVEAFSSAYFELLSKHPELAPYLAFSTSIVIVLGKSEAIQIVPVTKKPKKRARGPTKR